MIAGSTIMGSLVAYPTLAVLMVVGRLPGEFLAIFVLGLAYLHHAFSRADLSHVRQSVAALVILVVVATHYAGATGWALFAVLVLLTVWLLVDDIRRARSLKLTPVRLGSSNVDVPPWLAAIMSQPWRQHIDSGKEPVVWFTPLLVGLYPVIGQKSPTYDTFPVYPADDAAEQEMLAEIKLSQVDVAVIALLALDGNAALRFDQTYPTVWRHVTENFRELPPQPSMPGFVKVFCRAMS